jgi:hypothetical protein
MIAFLIFLLKSGTCIAVMFHRICHHLLLKVTNRIRIKKMIKLNRGWKSWMLTLIPSTSGLLNPLNLRTK